MDPKELQEFFSLIKQAKTSRDFRDYVTKLRQESIDYAIERPLFPNQFSYVIETFSNQIVFLSDSFENLTGIAVNTIKNTTDWYEIIHDEDRQTVINTGKLIYKWAFQIFPELDIADPLMVSIMVDYRIQTKVKGKYIRILRHTSFLAKDNENYPIYTLGVCTDITGIKRTNDIGISVQAPDGTQFFYNKLADESLTKREKEIIDLIIRGKKSIEIAEKLAISKLTVDTHRKNILRKTGARNQVELILSFFENDLIIHS